MAHIGVSEFKEVNWLPVHHRVSQIKLNHFHKIVHNKSPVYLREGVRWTEEVHNHRTRFSIRSIVLPRVNSHGSSSYLYTSINLWNSLPVQLRHVDDINKFKFSVKKHFLASLQAEENEDFIYF